MPIRWMPNHHAFINTFKDWWAKVLVMDLA